VIVAVMCLPLTERLLPPLRDRSGALLSLTLAVTVDRPVVLIAGGGVLLASVVFLALTATGVSRANLDLGLRSVRTTTGIKVRSIIVILQVAVCTLLLLMAGVFGRTLMQLRDVHAGFDKDYVATFTGDSSLRPVNLEAPFLAAVARPSARAPWRDVCLDRVRRRDARPRRLMDCCAGR